MNKFFNPSLVMIALAGIVSDLAAQEWTRFRGPNGTGLSQAKSVPTVITDADVNWKAELPGVGHSAPVFWGERLFITATGDKAGGFFALGLNVADGKVLWRRDFPLTPFQRHKFNSFASATPAVDAERVYVVWNDPEHYNLAALDHQGNVLWQRDFGSFVSQHGCGTSPIVYQGKVILGGEQDNQKADPDHQKDGHSFIVAVDAKTGRTIWQTPRRSEVVAYSTPFVYEPPGGKPAIVFNSQAHGIYAVDPDTGKVLWEFDQAFDKRSVSSPFLGGGLIFGSCGSGGGGNFVTAIKPGDPSRNRKPELAYQIRRSAPYVPTGVAVEDRVWLWSDSGIVTCLHAPSGEIRYQERVGGDFFGSPVWVDGRLYGISTAGDLVVVEASDTFRVLSRYSLNELCHSTPSVALGQLFIRTEKHLWSIGGPKEAASQ